MNIEQRVVKLQVIRQRERTKGWIFKRSEYVVTVRRIIDNAVNSYKVVFDGDRGNRTLGIGDTCEVLLNSPLLSIGDVLELPIYSSDARIWYQSREKAELDCKDTSQH